MKISQVTSSTIKTVRWDQNTLFIDFKNGTSYQYDGVPEKVYNDLAMAESAGSHFHRAVKGRYPFKQVPVAA